MTALLIIMRFYSNNNAGTMYVRITVSLSLPDSTAQGLIACSISARADSQSAIFAFNTQVIHHNDCTIRVTGDDHTAYRSLIHVIILYTLTLTITIMLTCFICTLQLNTHSSLQLALVTTCRGVNLSVGYMIM